MGAVERVRELVEPIVKRDGVELYDVEHESGVLRIMVDKPGGIDVDTIGDVTLVISQALDLTDPLPDSRYLLEVTSPGIERKLRTPQHFAVQIGEDINLKMKLGVEGERRFNARLDAADDTGIDVTIGDAELSVTRRIAYNDIEAARTIFHWGEQTNTPGAGKSKAAKPGPKKQKHNKKVSAR